MRGVLESSDGVLDGHILQIDSDTQFVKVA
jgi:hypothetical protein